MIGGDRMGREINVSSVAGDDHNRWLNANAVDYGSNPLDMLIRAEERGEVIVLTGLQWPYPGQDRTPHVADPNYPEVDPNGEPPRLYVGPCTCCGGTMNPRRWCAVCARASGKVKALPKEPTKKYTKNADGMKGGTGA